MPSNSAVHVAIELSSSAWLIAARLPGTEKSRLHRVEGRDSTALLAFFVELRQQASTRLGHAVDVACCFEAGRDGFWLHDLLTAHGIAAHVLEPTSVPVNRRARRAKVGSFSPATRPLATAASAPRFEKPWTSGQITSSRKASPGARASAFIFARDLLETLRRRELDGVATRLSAETGLPHRPSARGEHVAGIYRQRVSLASGRFAMIDDGMGFQLVPWRPALEQRLGQHVSGTVAQGNTIDWSFGRKRGLGI